MLHSNIAACLCELEEWDRVVRHCDDALALQSNAKASLRRARAKRALAKQAQQSEELEASEVKLLDKALNDMREAEKSLPCAPERVELEALFAQAQERQKQLVFGKLKNLGNMVSPSLHDTSYVIARCPL